MLMPSVQPGPGRFRIAAIAWDRRARRGSPRQRFAAVSFYLAMMTATCLELIGADGPDDHRRAVREKPGLRRDAVCGDRARGILRHRQRNRHKPGCGTAGRGKHQAEYRICPRCEVRRWKRKSQPI